ncbi:MAG: hypothetical protein PVJ63_05665 [Thioalkalispiraceae bacterium]|jgi:hypothetical protein
MTPFEPEPVIGQWYQDAQNRYFEVVASDEESVEIQFYDGNIEEIDMDSWGLLSVTYAAEPHDGISPFEELDFNETGFSEAGFDSRDWISSADFE